MPAVGKQESSITGMLLPLGFPVKGQDKIGVVAQKVILQESFHHVHNGFSR